MKRCPAALLVALACSACGSPDPTPTADAGDGCPAATDTVPHAPPATPRWAFEPWISKDISDTDDTYAFVAGFQQRDIPVGVVVLDSPWETNYNTFAPNPKRYHDFSKLSTDLHAGGVRLVLWITQMVNTSSLDLEVGGDKYDGQSPNYDEGARCQFFVNYSDKVVWWKGAGSGVDFFNPRATAWWHRQQDSILPLIDGWKLDFGDSYIYGDTVNTAIGDQPHQAYSEAYYRDFRDYGVKQRGSDFVTLVRGWDASYGFKGRFYARPEDAPVVWAGDNRRDAVGLADALDTMFRSARAGYLVVGSDVGGYLDVDDKTFAAVAPDWDVFARWTAVGALTPFMQLHGRANLTPWTIPDRPGHDGEMVALYRYWATLHHELVPLFYSLARQAQAKAPGDPAWQAIVRPVGDEASWAGDYRFTVGDALLVAPLVDGEAGTHTRDVALPAGASWVDWWNQGADPIAGGTVLTAYAGAVERPRLPLFMREGAIVPMAVSSTVTALGTSASKDHLTLLVYPGATESRFELREADDSTVTITAIRRMAQGGYQREIGMSRVTRATVMRVRTEQAPAAVSLDGKAVAMRADRDAVLGGTDAGAWFDTPDRVTWVLVPAGAGGAVVLRE